MDLIRKCYSPWWKCIEIKRKWNSALGFISIDCHASWPQGPGYLGSRTPCVFADLQKKELIWLGSLLFFNLSVLCNFSLFFTIVWDFAFCNLWWNSFSLGTGKGSALGKGGTSWVCWDPGYLGKGTHPKSPFLSYRVTVGWALWDLGSRYAVLLMRRI